MLSATMDPWMDPSEIAPEANWGHGMFLNTAFNKTFIDG